MEKVAGLIVQEGRILVARKDVPDRFEWIIPGGKPLPGESQEDTLRREVAEELGAEVREIRWFGWFADQATFEEVPLSMDVYEVTLDREPRPCGEITELAWLDRQYRQNGEVVGNFLERDILPALFGPDLPQ